MNEKKLEPLLTINTDSGIMPNKFFMIDFFNSSFQLLYLNLNY